jgi:hypothetical protein
MANTQVSHSLSPNNARSESCVVANPLNPNQLVGASKKFSNPNLYLFSVATYCSADAGNTWLESAAVPLLPGWGGISDPALAWDNAGNCFLVGLPFDNSGSMIVQGIAVYKSTNLGASWSAPSVIHASSGDDKQWAIGDPASGTVYAAWDDGSTLRFARTTNHGTSWKGTGAGTTPAGTSLATDSFSPEMALNALGHLYIFWSVRLTGTIKFVKSTDGGNTFSAPAIAVSGATDLETVLPSAGGFHHLPGGKFRVLTLVTCCTGQGTEIMVAWADGRQTDGMGNHVSRIYYRRSVDGGATWLGPSNGSPLVANDALIPKTLHHFHPQIINKPGTNYAACSFYEFGPKTGGKLLIDTRIAYSSNNGGSFGNASTVTDAPWDPLIDAPWSHGDPNVHFIGDYFGLDASSVGFYPFWTDTRTLIQEIFTDVVNPLVKIWKEPKELKEFKELKVEFKEHFKEFLKEPIDKYHVKEYVKEKDKDIYEDLGPKVASEVFDPIKHDLEERVRVLEGMIQELDRRTTKGDIFIKPAKRPDVARKVVRKSNRKRRPK